MAALWQFLIGGGAVALLIWMMLPSRDAGASSGGSGGEILDPGNARQLGMLIGMTGGTITDAAIARYAIERFAALHGRPATTRDAAVVVGLMMSMR